MTGTSTGASLVMVLVVEQLLMAIIITSIIRIEKKNLVCLILLDVYIFFLRVEAGAGLHPLRWFYLSIVV